MKLRSIIPFLFVVVGLLAARTEAQTPIQSAWFHYEQSKQHIKERNLDKALQEAKLMLELAPQMPEAEDLLGVIAALSGRLTDAETHFRRALRIRPDFVPAHYNLATTYLNLSKPEMAKQELEAVIRLNPKHAPAYYLLGVTLRDSKGSEALSYFRRARELEPSNVDVLKGLMECELILRQVAAAEKTYQEIELLVDGRDPRLLHIAASLAGHGAYASAIAAFQKVLRANPNSYDALYNLALSYFLNRDLKKAELTLDQLLQQHNVAEAHNLLARVYESRGAYLEALTEYEKAAVVERNNQDYRFDYCLFLVQHRALGFALSQLTSATKDFPRSGRLWAALGAAHYLQSNYDQAFQAMLLATEVEPALSQPYYYLGKLYERVDSQSQKQIMKKLRGYIAVNPIDPWAHYFYGSGLFQEQRILETRDFSEAEGYFRKAIGLKHDLANAYFGLGLLYYEKGKVVESILEFQRAAGSDPTMHEAHYRLGIAYSRLGKRRNPNRNLISSVSCVLKLPRS